MIRPRFIARAIADRGGYFWLPCPLCGRKFGGQEWRMVDGHMDTIPTPSRGEGASQGICPTCTRSGKGCTAWAESGVIHHFCDHSAWMRET